MEQHRVRLRRFLRSAAISSFRMLPDNASHLLEDDRLPLGSLSIFGLDLFPALGYDHVILSTLWQENNQGGQI